MSRMSVERTRKGFTLVELAVVIVIIGVLAAFGVPQFLKSVERSKAAEAFNYLSAVRSAQERYLAKQGIYASKLTDLDIVQTPPKYFYVGSDSANVDAITTTNADGKPTWKVTMFRIGDTSSYGAYEVTYDQTGYIGTGGISDAAADPSGASASTIPDDISPMGASTAAS
jgi:prepilin-type N-terminal cleavage/methylation domain-containing protein